MRLLKAQSTNLRSIYGKGVKYDINDIVELDSNKAVILPKGTTAERNSYTPVDGQMRYNTDDARFEMYEDGAWIGVRITAPASIGITAQNLGTGDASEQYFGPLASGDPDFPVPIAESHIIVIVGNVIQIPVTNYVLVQNPAGKPAGWYLDFGSSPLSVPDVGETVTAIHNFDK